MFHQVVLLEFRDAIGACVVEYVERLASVRMGVLDCVVQDCFGVRFRLFVQLLNRILAMLESGLLDFRHGPQRGCLVRVVKLVTKKA